MQKPKVLLIGQSYELLNPLLFLFFRAGFEVDVLTNFFLIKNKFIKNLEVAQDLPDLLRMASEKNLDHFDLVIICDDTTLRKIAELDLSIEKKLKLLPVKNSQSLKHIYSKIGLSETLKEKGINTPDFVVINSFEDAIKAAPNMGFPLLLKPDQSSGGQGIFEFLDQRDFDYFLQRNYFSPLTSSIEHSGEILSFPRLLQKKITGEEFDLSALYLDQKLVHFSCAKITKKIGDKFSVSLLRSYKQLATLDKSIFEEMEKLGRALSANGLISISAIKSDQDDKFYFFEADMRPNSWVDHTRFFGDDLAVRISDYFHTQKTLSYPQDLAKNYPEEILIPLCLRMSFFEVILNRYNVWRFISVTDFERLRTNSLRKTKHFFWRLNRIPTLTIRFFLPQKERRKNIKLKLRSLWIPQQSD